MPRHCRYAHLLDGEFELKALAKAYTSCSTLSSLPGYESDMVVDVEQARSVRSFDWAFTTSAISHASGVACVYLLSANADAIPAVSTAVSHSRVPSLLVSDTTAITMFQARAFGLTRSPTSSLIETPLLRTSASPRSKRVPFQSTAQHCTAEPRLVGPLQSSSTRALTSVRNKLPPSSLTCTLVVHRVCSFR